MFQQIDDPIQVLVSFKDGQIKPIKFLWHQREYLVTSVNLVYHHFEGRVKFYYFAVSDSANYFKLRFNADDLTWVLLETYSD